MLGLTIGTWPNEQAVLLTVPLTASFPLLCNDVALHRRSRSDRSKEVVELEAESAAIFSRARWRMSRTMMTIKYNSSGENQVQAYETSEQSEHLTRQLPVSLI